MTIDKQGEDLANVESVRALKADDDVAPQLSAPRRTPRVEIPPDRASLDRPPRPALRAAYATR